MFSGIKMRQVLVDNHNYEYEWFFCNSVCCQNNNREEKEYVQIFALNELKWLETCQPNAQFKERRGGRGCRDCNKSSDYVRA